VLHVVGVKNDPRAMFANSEVVRVGLSDAGFARVADISIRPLPAATAA
jgi:hypothetical protein